MRRPLLLAVLGLAVAAAALFALRTGHAPTLAPARAPIPEARWTAYRQAVEVTPTAPGPEDARLSLAFVEANRAEVAATLAPNGDPTTNPRFVRAAAELRAAALHLVQMRGGAAYVDHGRHRGLTLVEALAARPRGRPLRDVLGSAEGQALVDAGGAFALHAEASGLLETGAPALLQGVFLDHWTRHVRQRAPVTGYLRSDELEWLHRWRLEWHAAAPLEERLASAEALRVLPDYPADLNAGVALFQAGLYDEAARRFERAAGPEAEAFRRIAERAAAR